MTDADTDRTFPAAGTDPRVRPQDDLFGFVNGPWLEQAEIPADLPTAGAFIDLLLDAERQVADILQDAATRAGRGETDPGSAERKIGDLYSSFMAEDRVETLGAQPLSGDLAAIDAAADTTELLHLLGRLERAGVAGVLETSVDTDDRNSERYLVNPCVKAGSVFPTSPTTATSRSHRCGTSTSPTWPPCSLSSGDATARLPTRRSG